MKAIGRRYKGKVSHTRTSRPSWIVCPSGGSSLALVPGSSVAKIDPKSLTYRLAPREEKKKRILSTAIS